MAILSRKSQTKSRPSKDGLLRTGQEQKVKEISGNSSFSSGSDSRVLIRPRITEKASERAANAGVYVFDVARSATKLQISHAVHGLYKVNPVKIAMVTVPPKKVFVRGKIGHTAKGKKAYVYLKKGDKIDFV